MADETGKRCATCAFFVPYEETGTLGDGLGQCRGAVPQINWTDAGHSAAFPPTQATNWCGRWIDRITWNRPPPVHHDAASHAT
jgi:hypothetical protein